MNLTGPDIEGGAHSPQNMFCNIKEKYFDYVPNMLYKNVLYKFFSALYYIHKWDWEGERFCKGNLIFYIMVANIFLVCF